MVFLEDVVLGTFLSIFIAFFFLSMSLTIQWERVTDINPFLKLIGNFTRSELIGRTQLALMNLTAEPRPLATMLNSLWCFYLYTIIYFIQASLNLVRMELMELFCKESHFLRVKTSLVIPPPNKIIFRYYIFLYLLFYLYQGSSVYYWPL